jgi:hypothetical protein
MADECGFVVRVQDAACAGRLPAPRTHDGAENTHRLCIRNQVEAEVVTVIEWNRADAYHLGRLCEAVRTDSDAVTCRGCGEVYAHPVNCPAGFGRCDRCFGEELDAVDAMARAWEEEQGKKHGEETSGEETGDPQ